MEITNGAVSSSGSGSSGGASASRSEGAVDNDNGNGGIATTAIPTTRALPSSSSSTSSSLNSIATATANNAPTPSQSLRESDAASASPLSTTTSPAKTASTETNKAGDKATDDASSTNSPNAKNASIVVTQQQHQHSSSVSSDDDEITALTNGLGSVTLSSMPTIAATHEAPEAIRNLAAMLSSKNKYTNIVILTGAGISCNAGIPDFRTPGSGLYDNLQKYNLPHPTAVFDLEFYKANPSPFVQLASELWPGLKHSPTVTHSFIALLERKGMLLRNYTQNIDMLDVLAGVSEDKMIECHGHFRTAACTKCSRPFDGKECKHIIVEEKRAPICKTCGGYVKPDIVFFGEALPSKYHRVVKHDMKKADMLIVMGTSLMVGPVNMIPEMVSRSCRRVLLNRELAGTFLKRNHGPSTRRKSYDTSVQRDIFHKGDCDASIMSLCTLLGWKNELMELHLSTRLGS